RSGAWPHLGADPAARVGAGRPPLRRSRQFRARRVSRARADRTRRCVTMGRQRDALGGRASGAAIGGAQRRRLRQGTRPDGPGDRGPGRGAGDLMEPRRATRRQTDDAEWVDIPLGSLREKKDMARTYQIISADGHIEVPPDGWMRYVPDTYKDRAPR